jgi:hypothetical protein
MVVRLIRRVMQRERPTARDRRNDVSAAHIDSNAAERAAFNQASDDAANERHGSPREHGGQG